MVTPCITCVVLCKRQYEAPAVLVIIRIFIYFVFYLYYVLRHPATRPGRRDISMGFTHVSARPEGLPERFFLKRFLEALRLIPA